jgi:mannosyltransferase OCH1-like enzyme
MSDHDILRTGRGALPFRFDPPAALESVLELPRKLHFIWIGSQVPAKYLATVAEFERHNPGWQITGWFDRDGAHPPVPMVNADLYARERNMAAKADLLRYEIVYQHGGVYLDIDTLSLGPGSLDPLTHAFTTVSGAPWFNCSNAQFGFAAGSEFLAYVIKNARDPRVRAQAHDIPSRTGPTFLTTCLLAFNDWRIVAEDGAKLLAKIRHLADGNWVRDQ